MCSDLAENLPSPTETPPPSRMPKFTHVADRFAIWGLNVPYARDEAFMAAFRASAVPLIPLVQHKTPEVLRIEWKAYVCCWAARQALLIEGDFVECGVNYGLLSRTMAAYIDLASHPDRTLWLYDTFQGIPAAQMSAREAKGLGTWHNRNNYTEDVLPIARHRFAPFPNARLVPGMVPDTLHEVAPARVAWLHIDMNITLPEIAAAEFFWDRLSPGGVIILDDYAYAGHEEQMLAFQDFAAARGALVLPLPTGQGLIVKA